MTVNKTYELTRESGDRWLGQIPAHWTTPGLAQIVRIKNGADYKEVEATAGEGYPVIGSGGEFARATEYLYRGKSVLLGRKGTINKPLFVDEAFWTVDTMFYTDIGPMVDPRFFFYFCTRIDFGYYTTNTALPSMASSDLKAIRVGLPPLEEQRQIAEYLDRETGKIDTLIAKQKQLVATLIERRRATIVQAISRGADRDASLVSSGVQWLGEIPAHWVIKRVRDSVRSTKGGVWGNDANEDSNDIWCVRVADFDRLTLNVSKKKQTLRNVVGPERGGRILERGDLLLEKSGGGEKSPVGFVVLYDHDEPAVCSNFISRVRVADGQYPRFWLYVHAALYGTGLTGRSIKQTSGIQNLDQSSYFDESVAFPPLAEQIEIAAWLDVETQKMDALMASSIKVAELLSERRQALISATVTGKIDGRGL